MELKRLKKHLGETSRKDNGFTIIEVLIAIVILSIGILALTKMQITSIKANSTAMKFTEATTIAQDKIELLMGTPFSDVANGAETNADGYAVTWNITNSIDLDADGNIDILSINVVVNDPLGKKSADINFVRTADI